MNRKLIIQLLKSKTCEIQNLLDHFIDQPMELKNGIELLEARIKGLSEDFGILKKNIEPEVAKQEKEINEPAVRPISSTEFVTSELVTTETIKVDCEKIEPIEKLKPEQEIETEIRKELDTSIVNEQLQSETVKIIGEKLSNQKLLDIQSAIGINDRFLFMRELFENNSDAYESAISFVNEATTFESVMLWVKSNQNWDLEDPTVVQFIEITKRKF